jgi:hypothetical protein
MARPGQDWPSAEVAAALSFARSRAGWDLSTGAATLQARVMTSPPGRNPGTVMNNVGPAKSDNVTLVCHCAEDQVAHTSRVAITTGFEVQTLSRWPDPRETDWRPRGLETSRTPLHARALASSARRRFSPR